MSRRSKNEPVKSQRRTREETPRCLPIAQSGIKTSLDFAAMMSALMSDIIEERIEPRAATAVCSAGGKLLKVVELNLKYGQPGATPNEKVLQLAN